jgi:hypothetical protein
MDHISDSKIEKELSEYLVTIGYPKDSIVYEPAFPSKDGRRVYRPDFLIIDPITKERLALIEVKGLDRIDSKSTYRQLLTYREAIGSDTIPLFMVTPSGSNNSMFPFDLYVFGENGELIKSDFALFPTFPALSAEEVAERKSELREKKSKVTESFEFVSRGLAGLLVALVVIDFILVQFEITLLTTERMALLGASVALVVIPYAQKFKGLGIEWEKANKNNTNS